jgi:YfiH family protein
VSARPFLRAEPLDALGVEHGFGTLGSKERGPDDVHLARQVHGACVLAVPPAPEGREADALWSATAGTALGVCTADCVPVLLADASGRGAAAVHAGWRGAAARVAEAAVTALCRGIESRADALVAVIGPHIGPCCYEVDAPVRAALEEPDAFRPGRPGHWQLDLGLVIERQLARAGLTSVSRAGGCTACAPELYASYRRDGTGARMLHWVRVPPHARG